MLVASTAGSPDHTARIAKSTATVRPRGSLKILGLRFGAHEAYLDAAAGVIPHKPSGSPDNRIEYIQPVRIKEIVVPLQPAVVGLVIVAEDQLRNEPLASACGLVDDLRVTGPDAICGCHGSLAYGTFSMIATVPSYWVT